MEWRGYLLRSSDRDGASETTATSYDSNYPTDSENDTDNSKSLKASSLSSQYANV